MPNISIGTFLPKKRKKKEAMRPNICQISVSAFLFLKKKEKRRQ